MSDFTQAERIEIMQHENDRRLANATEALRQRMQYIESDLARIRDVLDMVNAGERSTLVGLGTPMSNMADFHETLALVNKMLENKCDLEFIATGETPKN